VIEGEVLEFRLHATDIDSDPLTLDTLDVPVNASFVDSGNGAGSFTFAPDFTQSGVYYVTFIASDGSLADSEVVEITVSEFGNHAPDLDSIGPQVVVEGEVLEFRIHATDIDSDPLILDTLDVPVNASFVDSGNGAGSFTFAPDFTQAGVYYVTFIASDGSLSDSEVVEITVTEFGNHAPELDSIGPQVVVEGEILEFRLHATDIDSDPLVLDTLDVPVNATFIDSGNGAGLFTFAPDFTQSGVYYVTFIASDGSLSDSEVVEITVTEFGNHAPELDSIGPQVVVEGEVLEFRLHATDIDSDPLVLDTLDVPVNATFIDSGNGAGLFTFAPDFTQSGVYYVTFIASDGSLSDSEIVEIVVGEAGNQVPELDSIGAKTVMEGETLEFSVHATDPDLDSIILEASNVPINATFADSGNGAGSFVFTPDFTQSGPYTVTFIASDGSLADSEVVEITVTEFGNHAPELDSIGPQVVVEGEVLEFRVHATDIDSDPLILDTLDVPVNASFIDSGNGAGSFTFAPDFTQSGVYYVTFIASDGSLADSEVVEITVNDVNRAPMADAGVDQSGVEANTLVTLDGSASYDPDGDSITYAWTQVGGPTVTLSDSAAVQPTFTPAIKGDYVFQLIVNDGFLDSQPDSVTVSVNNQTPIADAGPDQLGVDNNTMVTLDGSGSYDPDGDSVSHEWIQLSGPLVSLSDSTLVNPTFTPVLTGDYLFQLTVSDGFVFSQPDTVLINVPAPPEVVVDLMAAISGDSVLLSWSAVITDTSGQGISVHHYVIYRGTKAYFVPMSSDSIGFTDSITLAFADSGVGGVDIVGDVSTNYYYVIKAVDIYGNYSDVSNRVGEYDYQIVVTPTTDFSYVTLPFTGTGIIDADGLIASIGASNINNVNRFVQSSQSYQARFAAGYGTNFAVAAGGIYQVNAKINTIWSIAGTIPPAGSISYTIITTPTTDFNLVSIPFEDEDVYQTAQDVIDSLPGALNTLNNFIPSSQSWESRFAAGYGPNFVVKPGGVYQANAKALATFPPAK
jgi:PKD repeat protein